MPEFTFSGVFALMDMIGFYGSEDGVESCLGENNVDLWLFITSLLR